MTAELRLPALARRRVERVSALLFELGALGLQEAWLPGEAPEPLQPWDEGPPPPEPERVVLIAWFDESSAPGPDRAAIERRLRPLTGPVVPEWGSAPEVDWEQSWKDSFPPIVVSERLTVAAPWNAPPGALIVEPGQGFGTGHHLTTLQALRALDALTPESHDLQTAIDVGCGSGILAIVAAARGMRVIGVDVEEAAIREAAENAARNGLTGHFSTEPVSALAEPADLVLANLHAELVRALAADLVRLTGRWLVVAGILQDREAIVHEALSGLLLAQRAAEEGWVSLVYRRAS
jgi:ribosomal protein L11 methyltransferase